MARKRTDANHAEIGRALRELGLPVIDLSAVGKGCADYITRKFSGRMVFIEVKTDAGKLNGAQLVMKEIWGDDYQIARNVDDAIAIVKA